MADYFQAMTIVDEIRQDLKPESVNRKFIYHHQIQPRDVVINVLQWNILAQALSYPDGNFVRVAPAAVDYESRKWRILEQILTYRADLMALEEMDIFTSFLQEYLPKSGYDCFFTPKPNSRCLMFSDTKDFKGPDGILMCYRTNLFKLRDKKVGELPDDGRHAKQIFTVFELMHKPSELPIVFIGTHFKAKKQFANSRTNQAVKLVEFINHNYSVNDHIILVGDFNGERDEEFYKVILNANFSSSYRMLNGNHEPPYTTWKFKAREGLEKEESRTIDYIFFRSAALKPIGYLEIPKKEDIGVDGLPSLSYPSDHFALQTVFLVDS